MPIVVRPNEKPVVCVGESVVFLAGPIQGAADWQSEAIRQLSTRTELSFVASPRRDHREWEFSYDAQVDWETWWLEAAAKHGVILFWMAREAEHSCSRAYAQTTRFELAEWKERASRYGTKLAIGIDPGYTGERYIRRRLRQDIPWIPVRDTLGETVRDALGVLAARYDWHDWP